MSREPLSTQGRLEKFSVLRLLQGVMDEDRTGCLKVTRDGVERKLYVKEGMIIYASSTEPEDRLGEIFITQGKLTREEVDEMLSRSVEERVLIGRILLVEGRITSLDLFQGVTAQVVSIVERMRGWRKGDFVFDEEDKPPSGAVLLRIPLSLYLGGAERKKKAPPRREDKKTVLPPPAAEEVDDFEVEIVIEDDSYGEVAFPEKGGAPREEEGSPPPGGERAAEESEAGEEEREPAAAEGEAGEAAEGSAPGDPPRPAAEQSWGEVVFPGDETSGAVISGGNGEKEAAEFQFHLQELRQRRGGDARTLLGVSKDASKEEILEAYHYLASALHPDHLSPDNAGEDAEEANELFKEVTAAYEELTAAGRKDGAADSRGAAPPSREGTRMPAPGALDPGDEARRQFYKAKEYIAGGNYWQAADALREVVRQKPKDASCRNLLGFCLMQTGRRLHEAEEHLKEAIRLDPGNPDYLVNLGLVYKAGRSFKKARAIFQQALLYEKDHAMARQELKNLPREIEWGRESGGFWKKLFG